MHVGPVPVNTLRGRSADRLNNELLTHWLSLRPTERSRQFWFILVKNRQRTVRQTEKQTDNEANKRNP